MAFEEKTKFYSRLKEVGVGERRKALVEQNFFEK